MKEKWVYWECDKRDCLKQNHRQIGLHDIIMSDVCDHCDKHIHEPIVLEMQLSGDSK
jgi:hypothetical protein